MADDIAIKVEHVTKTFKLPLEKNSSLKSTLINFNKRGYEKQIALEDISFEVKKGEFFGIVGRNGSGKSTLLKLLSGIYTPDSGVVTIDGKLTPFIELGVGFNPELSGRDNVYLNGALLGFNRSEMAAMYDEIVKFAELERFMDQKLKNYSSGMQVRLAFSIAIRANTDILVLDEVLAVGDEAFQRKCFHYFNELKRRRKTVVLVTHDMSSVEKFCTRALILKDGEIRQIGSPQEIAASYLIENSENIRKDYSKGTITRQDSGIMITGLDVYKDDVESSHFKHTDTLAARISYRVTRPQKISFGVSVRKDDDQLLAAVESEPYIGDFNATAGEGEIRCIIPLGQFRKGDYKINTSLWSADDHALLDFRDSTMGTPVPRISILDEADTIAGLFAMNVDWRKSTQKAKAKE
jgi:ABC-2 type transport system ATP-binding protein